MGTRERIWSTVAEFTAVTDPRPADDVSLDRIGLDSLQLVRFVMRLEEVFGVEFFDGELVAENFASVTAVQRMVERAKPPDDGPVRGTAAEGTVSDLGASGE